MDHVSEIEMMMMMMIGPEQILATIEIDVFC